MQRLLICVLLISSASAYAQDQQSNAAKLKADAQKIVRTISHDTSKTQTYCQIESIGQEIDREKDSKKAETLLQRMDELEKQLGPEYLAFVEATKTIDPDSKEAQDIEAMFDELDESCPD